MKILNLTKKGFLKSMVLLMFIGMYSTASAQVELKVNPIGILFKSPDVAAEFLVGENFGVEARIGVNWNKFDLGGAEYKSSGFNLIGVGKYYFNSDVRCDKFYVGAYAKFGTSSSKSDGVENISNVRVAIGPMFGYKWLAANDKVSFEIGLGVGRAFINKYGDEATDDFINATPFGDLDVIGTLAVGYRFGGE